MRSRKQEVTRLLIVQVNPCSYFVSSLRERKKRDRRDSRGDEREGQGRKRKMNESEEIKTFPLYPYLLQGQQALPSCKPISFGRPAT